MPRGDMTGPPSGRGAGRGRGMGKGIGGGGRMSGSRPGSGPGGECVWPKCKAKVPHQAGVPCYTVSCPKCGTKMVKA